MTPIRSLRPAARSDLPPQRSRRIPALGSYVRATRPYQWPKNLLVFLAPAAAGQLFQQDTLLPATAALVAFVFVSAAAYLFNDTLDRVADQHHPAKQARPIAAGTVSVRGATALAATLTAAGVALAFRTTPELGLVVVAYVFTTLAYSLRLKHTAGVELLVLTFGFLLRAFAGTAATGVALSPWLVAVVGSGALFIASGKRYCELARVSAHPECARQLAPARRRCLDGYTLHGLRFVYACAAVFTVVAYASWAVEVSWGTPATWTLASVLPFAAAVLVYGRMIRQGKAESPERALFATPAAGVASFLWLACFILATLGVR